MMSGMGMTRSQGGEEATKGNTRTIVRVVTSLEGEVAEGVADREGEGDETTRTETKIKISHTSKGRKRSLLKLKSPRS
jgi:hypothetical protein